MADNNTEPERESRKVRHAAFSYLGEGNAFMVAVRNQVVELLPEDVKRGEKHGAFYENVDAESEQVGALNEFNPNMTDEELVAWLKAADQDAVVQLLDDNPEHRERVIQFWLRQATVPNVTDLLSESPELWPLVLEKEKQNTNDSPRAGVVQAAAAAQSALNG